MGGGLAVCPGSAFGYPNSFTAYYVGCDYARGGNFIRRGSPTRSPTRLSALRRPGSAEGGRYLRAALLDLVEEFRSILSALQAAEIEFAVCGGLAVAIHAHPRATLDIDLLLPRDQVERAREMTRQLGYQIETGAMTLRRDVIEIFRLSKCDPETGDLLSLDLLVVTPELERVWRTRERVDWEYGSVPVVSRAGLVAMKRLRGSGQDLDDIRMLEDDDGSH